MFQGLRPRPGGWAWRTPRRMLPLMRENAPYQPSVKRASSTSVSALVFAPWGSSELVAHPDRKRARLDWHDVVLGAAHRDLTFRIAIEFAPLVGDVADEDVEIKQRE